MKMKMLCSECGTEKGKEHECECCGNQIYVCSESLIFEDETVKCGCGSVSFETINETEMDKIKITACVCNHCSNLLYIETYPDKNESQGIFENKLTLIRPKDGEKFYFDDITIDIETKKISYISIHTKPDELGFVERYRYDFEKEYWCDMFKFSFGVDIEELERMFKTVGLIEY